MKKGFTLMEMIAVIGILALMTLIILPNLLNQVNNKKEELSNTMKNMIYSATDLYLNENVENYPKIAGNTYCIKLQELVNANYLKTPLTDVETGGTIDLNQKVSITVDAYGQYDDFNFGDCE